MKLKQQYAKLFIQIKKHAKGQIIRAQGLTMIEHPFEARRAHAFVAGIFISAISAFNIPVLAQTDRPFESPIPAMTRTDLDQGQSLFRVHCARCHGMLGEGGEGPSLKRARLTHAPNDMALYSVINQGIPGTGMPGDPLRGEALYASSGNCSSCHILDGVGRGIGPELSAVGLRRNSEYLRRSLTNPDADQPKIASQMRGTLNSFLTVRVVSELGTYEGMRINEDEFSVQMRDLSGNIYSFDKAKLLLYEKDFGHSLMPGYGAALGDSEVDDMVSYLMSLKGEQ